MTSNQTICDLCSTGVASERLHESGFSTLSVQGSARNLIQPLAGPGATSLDLCPACGKALAEWLHGRKAQTVSGHASAAAAPETQPAASAHAPSAPISEHT